MKSLKKLGIRRSNSDVGNKESTSYRTEDDEDGGFFDAPEALLHIDAHEEGGLGLTNKKLLEVQRSAIMELAKDVGKKLLTGSFNLINLSMPVKMFEPRSYLQKLTDVWVYPRILDRAVAAQDPVLQMKEVVTWFAAGLQHVFQSWAKPFNPILGETYQASQPDGTAIYLEQISHHPPISAFEMVGPGSCYTFSGLSQPDVQYKGNAVKTTAKGYRTITFNNGSSIDITYPAYYIRGIIGSGMPRADIGGRAYFLNKQDRIFAEICFGKVEDASEELLRRPDSFTGGIYRLPPEWKVGDPVPTLKAKTASITAFTGSLGGLLNSSTKSSDSGLAGLHALARCQGNWLSHLDWDGRREWTLVAEQPTFWTPCPTPLPSDCRYRQDLDQLLQKDLVQSQQCKELLENRQRADAKLRKLALSGAQ